MVVVLNGKELSKNIKNKLKDILLNYQDKPGLAIILVGDRSDSEIYVRMKKKACEFVGINFPTNVKHLAIDTIKPFSDNFINSFSKKIFSLA